MRARHTGRVGGTAVHPRLVARSATRQAIAMQRPALHGAPALVHRATHHFRRIARLFHRGEAKLRATIPTTRTRPSSS
jgi:hypothetical protein